MIEYIVCTFVVCVMIILVVFMFLYFNEDKEHECVFSEHIRCTRKYCDVKGCSISRYTIRKWIKREIENVQSGKES